MKTFVNTLFLGSCLGFCGVAAVHIAALTGSTYFFRQTEKLMFPVLFALWIPMIFCINRLAKGVQQKDIWKAALRGSPPWMRTTTYALFGYGSFSVSLNGFFPGHRVTPDIAAARATSGMMTAFYAVAVAVCVLYSFTHVSGADESRH